jgi:hypothetical protein
MHQSFCKDTKFLSEIQIFEQKKFEFLSSLVFSFQAG